MARLRAVCALGAIGALAGPGCASKAAQPSTIGSVPQAGAGEAAPARRPPLSMCEAIAAAVDAAPTFRALAADPDGHDVGADQPATIEVEGGEVTVLLREDSPDLTLTYPGGIPQFNQFRKVFVECPVFQSGEWQLAQQDVDDLELPEDRDHRIRFARPDNLLAWMKVMGNGELMIVIH